MDNRQEIRAFLKSRRDRITPEQAGLPSYGNRRVTGLRRSEVAVLAGVSVEYYTRLERGSLGGVSDGVLDALVLALRLDDIERAHLYDLARAAQAATGRARRRSVPAAESAQVRPGVRPGVRRIVEGMPGLPAFVQNNRFDVLIANPLARALYSEMYADPTAGANTARFVFLGPSARRLYTDWEQVARGAVGALRVEAGRNPYDRELSNLIGELSTRSDSFRVLWGAHDVHVFREGTKRFRHPVVGDLELDHEAMALPGDTGQSVVVYSAPAGTAAEDGLRLLASWSASEGDTSEGDTADGDTAKGDAPEGSGPQGSGPEAERSFRGPRV
ncbi:helix-turn-helix transcriptional regulator [Streptomyces corynorhini]|uniref:XRE family transcriptional regulator n=1 Tax=Streptomyces corynorhini TaxID=2282652 RepID=A0A370B4P1_9ACTN|nr:helix-turn-helix transcriptional regulator [Streptomyces corynorhini]RDG36780.1 XRE family transcriptional regulator [Streptomyces corynorhini]